MGTPVLVMDVEGPAPEKSPKALQKAGTRRLRGSGKNASATPSRRSSTQSQKGGGSAQRDGVAKSGKPKKAKKSAGTPTLMPELLPDLGTEAPLPDTAPRLPEPMYRGPGPEVPPPPPLPRDALEGKGPQRRPQRRLGRRLEEVAKAVGGGYCRLQMSLKLALGVGGGSGWA